MRREGWILLAAALMALAGSIAPAARAWPTSTGAGAAAGALLLLDGPSPPTLVIDRPEIRSYQPYSGLQFGFRPKPPILRGVRSKRPEIVMPKPVAPLIEYIHPNPYSAQWYTYCPESPQGLEPREGPYAGAPVGQRQCP